MKENPKEVAREVCRAGTQKQAPLSIFFQNHIRTLCFCVENGNHIATTGRKLYPSQISDVFTGSLRDAVVFSTLNVNYAFLQHEIGDADHNYIAFTSHRILCPYLRRLFELQTSANRFQRALNVILVAISYKYLRAYAEHKVRRFSIGPNTVRIGGHPVTSPLKMYRVAPIEGPEDTRKDLSTSMTHMKKKRNGSEKEVYGEFHNLN